ncbi:MAG: glycosyltransferase family 87 protein [Pseudomonadota bacterium]
MTATQRHQLTAWTNAVTMAVIFATFVYLGIDFPERVDCVTRFIDFHAIWGAARLALEGSIVSAFDRSVLEQAYGACGEVKMYWLYPAPMTPLITPLGLLPFLAAFLGFVIASIAVLFLSLRSFLPNDRPALIAFAFAPAWLPALVIGQFTLFWCAGLMAAITAIRANRPVIAGLILGLLTVKPTLGLLIPVVLLADRRYLTIVVAMISTIALHLSALAIYGFDYLQAWVTATRDHGANLAENLIELKAMGSIATFLAQMGASNDLALRTNAAALVILGILLFFVWRKAGARSDAACAALCAALPLSTPYLWHNDVAFSALVALFLYRADTANHSVLFRCVLFVLWAGPGLTIINAYTLQIPWVMPATIDAPILMLALAASVWQFGRQPTPPNESHAA